MGAFRVSDLRVSGFGSRGLLGFVRGFLGDYQGLVRGLIRGLLGV